MAAKNRGGSPRWVDTPNEMPELLVELSDGTLRGLGLSRGDVCRIHAKS
jgi:uncharacterized protein YjiS (DUF1127 family)